MTIDHPQRLLLRAVCLETVSARDAWCSWRRLVDLDDVDPASGQLLPALARRPDVLGDDPDAGRIRGTYRRAWAHNARLRDGVQPALRSMVAAGVPVALLGPSAMARFHGGDAGVRPADVVDVLVRPADAGRAARLLCAAGWAGGGEGTYRRGDGVLRLHARSVPTSVGGRADDSLWGGARRGQDGVYEVDAAHLLVHLLVTGGDEGIAWVADAHRLGMEIRSAADLASLARAHNVVGACIARLDILAAVTGTVAHPNAVTGTVAHPNAVTGTVAHPNAVTGRVAHPNGATGAGTVAHLDELRRRGPRVTERLHGVTGGRIARGIGLVVAHGAGRRGLVPGVASLISQRLDLVHAARPSVTVVHAALGRPSVVARLARRFGPLGRVDVPNVRPLAAGTILDFAEPSTLAAYGAAGWRAPGPAGAPSRGNEARLLLPIDGPVTLGFDLAADQTAPVEILVDERRLGSTPGRGGPASAQVVVPGGRRTVEVALRSSARTGLWPRPLFVILRSVTVSS